MGDMREPDRAEQAYLIARGVRALALLGHCSADPLEMLIHLSQLERSAEQGTIPFVVDRGAGIADYGYAAARWVVDLYQWVVTADAATLPTSHRDRIIGLLLGYSVEAIRNDEEQASGRRFDGPPASGVWPGQASSVWPDGTSDTAGTARTGSGQSPEDTCSFHRRCPTVDRSDRP